MHLNFNKLLWFKLIPLCYRLNHVRAIFLQLPLELQCHSTTSSTWNEIQIQNAEDAQSKFRRIHDLRLLEYIFYHKLVLYVNYQCDKKHWSIVLTQKYVNSIYQYRSSKIFTLARSFVSFSKSDTHFTCYFLLQRHVSHDPCGKQSWPCPTAQGQWGWRSDPGYKVKRKYTLWASNKGSV